MALTRFFNLILFLGLTFQILKGQPVSSQVSGELEMLFGRLLTVSDDSMRIQINDSIKTIVDSYVESDTIFFHSFSKVRFLGQITSADSLIKVVTWNLFLRNQPGQYHCYIIRNKPETKSRKVYRLFAEYDSSAIMADTTYTSGNWYGALYYAVRPQIIKGKNCWVLLGIDYGNPLITRKIIDILTFDRDDSLLFGLKSFFSDKGIGYRELFEYSATATMTMRFGGDDTIIFDHLVPFSPEMINDRQYYGPHYSNDAYILENGFWKLKINVDARNKEKVKP